MPSLISIGVVAASVLGAQAANTRQDCLASILHHVPHMAKAFEYLDLPHGEFTMFAPSEVAAERFIKLFTRDGCKTISKKRLKQLVNASLVPGHNLRTHKLTSQPRQYDGALPGHALELSKAGGGGVHIGVVSPGGKVSDVIVEARAAPPLRSCKRGALYLSDDFVVPPELHARILEVLEGEGGCAADLDGGDEGPDGKEDATVIAADTKTELATPSATASVPVAARVHASSTDKSGKVTPLDSEVTLDVEAGLEELGRAKSTDVNVEVPVTVNVNVDGGPCDAKGADVEVPVDVDVSVDILIDGKPIGTGKGGVVFDKCREGAVERWGQCGGIVYSRRGRGRGKPRHFASACAEGVCVRKNRWFAMCVPHGRRRVFTEQGWDGKVLVCRKH